VIGDGSQGAAMTVLQAAQGGLLGFARRGVLSGNPRIMIHRVGEQAIAGLPSNSDVVFA
jgi:hypothetical protein